MVRLLHRLWLAVCTWRSTYVHAHCTDGGVAHDQELHPKKPTDQDVVAAVARQRDCITQAAANSEILLLPTASSDQAPTAAPADDELSMFGREEALRVDEEIMNIQRIDTVTWANIKDVQFALQQPRTSVFPCHSCFLLKCHCMFLHCAAKN